MDGLLPFDAVSHDRKSPATSDIISSDKAPSDRASGAGDAEILAALRLARSRGVGPLTWRRLVERFGSANAALAAWPDLARRHKLDTHIPAAGEAVAELERLAAMGGRLLVLGHVGYPAALAEIADPPPVLALLGDGRSLTQAPVAMVGARSASLNGCGLAQDLAQGLAAAGHVVVSGLARGIDTAAHSGALRVAGEGPVTVAVLAGGLDQPYPPENAGLMARIAERGAVVSEVALGTAPRARHFPRRNRIIAGLSLGTVVIEAALRSGSLITARLANEQGREVMAVPGSPLDARSRGCNALLRDGATLIESIDDILYVLPAVARPVGPISAPRARPSSASPTVARVPARRSAAVALAVSDTARTDPVLAAVAGPDASSVAAADPASMADPLRRIADLLGAAPTAMDELLRDSGLPPAAVSAALLELELSGRLARHAGNKVSLQSAAPLAGPSL